MWDYETSFTYWNRRLHAATNVTLPSAIDTFDQQLRAQEEAQRHMANDSRLHSEMRQFARQMAKSLSLHNTGQCTNTPNKWGVVRPCDYCRHRADFLRLLALYPDVPSAHAAPPVSSDRSS